MEALVHVRDSIVHVLLLNDVKRSNLSIIYMYMSLQQMHQEKVKGLGILTCAVFIVGEIAGSGVLALPSAVEGAGKGFPQV